MISQIRLTRRIPIALALTAAVFGMAGCADLGPKPWEKDLMARKEMAVAAYPMQIATDQHIYFSKEASSGGRGFAGGGCGCN